MLLFLYSVLLKLLYPTSIAVLLLLASALLRCRGRARRGAGSTEQATPATEQGAGQGTEPLARLCFWAGLAVLLICGNGWVVRFSTRHLERQYPPLEETHYPPQTADTSVVNGQWSVVSGPFSADVILVLGDGTLPAIAPRPTVEVDDAGDRLLYAAHLYKTRRAPQILCTSGIGSAGLALSPRPIAHDMAELLENIGVPRGAILKETKARNTHEHAVYLSGFLQEKGFKRVLLVTSAAHMPRAMAVFKLGCPGIEFVAAPTDFRVVDVPMPWYRELVNLIPTPSNLQQFSETMHEYLGLVWYKMRGWA